MFNALLERVAQHVSLLPPSKLLIEACGYAPSHPNQSALIFSFM